MVMNQGFTDCSLKKKKKKQENIFWFIHKSQLSIVSRDPNKRGTNNKKNNM